MARLARVEVFAADEIAIVRVMNRTVRRAFLCGEGCEHRKQWIEDRLRELDSILPSKWPRMRCSTTNGLRSQAE